MPIEANHTPTTKTRGVAWLQAVLGALLLQACLFGAAFLWVVVYSHGVSPGRSLAEYEEYAQQSSPIVAFVVCGPLFFLTGAILRRTAGERAVGTAVALMVMVIGLNLLLILLMAEYGVYNLLVELLMVFIQAGSLYLGVRCGPGIGSVPATA